MKLDVGYEILPGRRTVRGSQVMDHFGIDFEVGRHVVVEDFELPVEAGTVVCFTGDSGSGKSSLLRGVAGQLEGVLNLDEVELPDGTLVDGLPVGWEEGLGILAGCGLSEARLLLRRPNELSEGERYRYRLAVAIAHKPRWLMSDEFTATLDRTLAKVIAFNVRKLCDREGIGFLVATTHEDICEDLQADVDVRCRLGSEPEVRVRERGAAGAVVGGQKKSGSVLRSGCGSVRGPSATGRISRGGIIEEVGWGL